MATLIERDSNLGIYDLLKQEMIVQLDDGRRIYLSEGFGGMSTLQGGQYRWQHGVAVAILADDTLESLHTDTLEYDCHSYQQMMAGYDETRPVLAWDGYVIDRIARSV